MCIDPGGEPASADHIRAPGETDWQSKADELPPDDRYDRIDEHVDSPTREWLIKIGSDQRLTPPRRGQSRSTAPLEVRILIEAQDASRLAHSGTAVTPDDGIWVIAARILSWLTVGTLFPAALFAVSVTALLQIRETEPINVSQALRSLNPIPHLALAFLLFMIAAIVINAFSFEAIRNLEGYWRSRGIIGLARTLMIQKHVRRKERVAKRRRSATRDAFYATKPRMLRKGISSPIVMAFEAQVVGKDMPVMRDQEAGAFAKMDWRSLCDPWRLARIDHLLNEELSYPTVSRILPTRLGNMIRATEDRLENTAGDLQNFALRRHGLVSRRIQMRHDQFRSRLGLYCMLVFVSALLVVLTPVILFKTVVGFAAIALISGSYIVLGMVSYFAALASAAGYCVILKEMDETHPDL